MFNFSTVINIYKYFELDFELENNWSHKLSGSAIESVINNKKEEQEDKVINLEDHKK